MKNRDLVSVIFSAILFTGSAATAALPPNSDTPATTTESSNDLAQLRVRVRLGSVGSSFSLEASGLALNSMPIDKIENVALMTSRALEIHLKRSFGKFVWITSREKVIHRFEGDLLKVEAGDGLVRINSRNYRPPLILSARNGAVDVIASTDLESYIEGVLAGEMPASWPMEAIKAQAIAARSYALEKILQRRDAIYHLEASVFDQMFIVSGDRYSKEKYHRAVQATAGIILKQGTGILRAHFHSDCGGQTEDVRYVWQNRGGPRLNSVKDDRCALNPASKWRFMITRHDLIEKLDRFLESTQDRSISDLPYLSNGEEAFVRVNNRSPSGRVVDLAFNEDGKSFKISGQDLRQALGFDRLKSTLFEVSVEGDSVIFSGRGNGHGAGLCQYGARFFAEQGQKSAQILKHYYPAAHLEKF